MGDVIQFPRRQRPARDLAGSVREVYRTHEPMARMLRELVQIAKVALPPNLDLIARIGAAVAAPGYSNGATK